MEMRNISVIVVRFNTGYRGDRGCSVFVRLSYFVRNSDSVVMFFNITIIDPL